ncbi:MAG: hypothetical protein H6Q15_907 [Bacteroidetes bacterium]|nr:hypothetical protein [Bacteroidota bacterium]
MKNWFSNKYQEAKQSFQRIFKSYLLELITSIAFALSFIITNIFFEKWQETYIDNFYFCFPICFGIIYSINLFTQNTKQRYLYYISFLIIPLIYLLKIDMSERMFIALITTILLIYIAKKRKENIYFVSTIIQSLTSIAISIILASICIGLLYSILESIKYIFEIELVHRTFEKIFFGFSYMVVFPIIFLIFDTKTERKILGDKLDTILIKYILTPAFYIFGIILYVYFAKILISFSLPQGVVSATAIGFLMLGLVIKTATDSYEKPFQKWFFPYFSYYSIPALIMLWIATMVRVLEYGLTIPRVYLLLSVIILTIWIIALLFKHSKKYYILSIITIIIISSFTFIPYIDAKSIEKYSQASRPISEKDKLEEAATINYLSNPMISFDISNYKQLINLIYNNSEDKDWHYSSDEKKIKIYNDKGDNVFKADNKVLLQEQIQRLGISIEKFKQIKDKEDYVKKNPNKFFIKDTPTMTIVFSNINFKNNLKDEISFHVDYILIK